MKWASPQERAAISIEPESEVTTCCLSLARRHVRENAARTIARAADVATGRLPSLGDRVNRSAQSLSCLPFHATGFNGPALRPV